MEKKEKSTFAGWLESLQQESWQLELIVSGFAIFLLLGVYEPLQGLWKKGIETAGSSDEFTLLLLLPLLILQGSWLVLLINLIVHVLLRGLWISTVGLRYVSEDIDFDKLRLLPRYDRFLRKHIGSFDLYIERLEKICSVIFAFSFLLVFILFSLGLWLSLFGIIDVLTEKLPFGQRAKDIMDNTLSIIVFLTSLPYFIDFLTLGWIKRQKWMVRFYYPFYRFYGWVTLSFLYRPMYYNLVDNRFGRRVGFLLIPYIILIMIVSSLTISTDTYFPTDPGNLAVSHRVYDDLRDEETFFNRATIPSKYINNGYLELFILYSSKPDDAAIEVQCPGLTPARRTGIRTGGVIQVNGQPLGIRNTDNDSLLQCMSQIHEVYIDDSLYTDLKYRFYTHPDRQKPGLLTIVDVNHLERGEHLLIVKDYIASRDSVIESVRIPFWKE